MSESTAPSSSNNFPEWRVELARMIRDNGSFPDGQVTSDIQAFAAKYDVSFATARSGYYTYLKGIPSEIAEILEQEDRAKVAGTVSNTSNNKAPDVLDIYKVGSIVEVRVVYILTHGAVVETVDDSKQEGFIYVGNITNTFVNDINKYFRIGDIVRAKVLKYDAVKDQLTLSTKNLPMKDHGVTGLGGSLKPEPINTLSKEDSRLQALREDLLAQQQAAAASAAPVPAEETSLSQSVNASELNDIREFIRGVIGSEPSDAAVQAFLGMFSTYGVFKTSIAMARAADGFDVDLGLLLAQKVGDFIAGDTPS